MIRSYWENKLSLSLKNNLLSSLLAWSLLGVSTSIQAQPLEALLRYALINDPTLLEARASELGAKSNVKAAQAGHYPIVSVIGTQPLAQHHRNDNAKARFDPGLRGVVNVYSWGQISNNVKQAQSKEEYFHHKYFETQEELGNTIGQLYLSALRASDTLKMLQNNLLRHDKIIHDLEIIVRHDSGRQSELTQAQSRRLQVENNIVQNQRILDMSLSRLARYSDKNIVAQDLETPFSEKQLEVILNTYRNDEIAQLPGFQAQRAEMQSIESELAANKAALLPKLNLEGQVTRDTREVHLSVAWNVFDRAAKHTVNEYAQTLVAAEEKLNRMGRELTERSRTAELDMRQSYQRAELAKKQIEAQQKVVRAYDLQFKIARRTLIEVLDSYSELSNIELAYAAAVNDYRDAVLSYLYSQGKITEWAGVPNN